METQIQSYAFSKRDAGPVTFFGYATKSLPGLEVHGLGKYGKALKEKIIFLTRSRRLAVPLKRFVISAEYELEQDPEALKWFDLPVLLAYWHLAGLLPLARLDNCLAVGAVTPGGKLLGRAEAELEDLARKEGWSLLGPVEPVNGMTWLDARELLGHIPGLDFNPRRIPSASP